MKEKVVIIGANEFQNSLICKAKEKGYETHVFAWAAGAIGEKTADYFYPISITEKEAILEKCNSIHPVGVASIASDLAVVTVNYLADKLCLTGNSMESTELSTKKNRMRQAFAEGGNPSPKSICVTDFKEVESLLGRDMKLPLIVKPTDRSGSRGITKITARTQLKDAVREAMEQSLEKKAVIEEFAEGKEYSVEFISYQGAHIFLALTEKFTTDAPHFIETGHFQPAEMSEERQQKIVTVLTHALDSLQIKNGASHCEIKIDETGKIMIIEIGARMGGDCIGSDLTPISTGFDYVGMVLDIACGKTPDFSRKEEKAYTFIRFLFEKRDEEIYHGIKKEYPDSFASEYLNPVLKEEVTDSSKRYGYYIIKEKSRTKMMEIIKKVYG